MSRLRPVIGTFLLSARGLYDMLHSGCIVASILWIRFLRPESITNNNVGNIVYVYEHFHAATCGQGREYKLDVSGNLLSVLSYCLRLFYCLSHKIWPIVWYHALQVEAFAITLNKPGVIFLLRDYRNLG